MNLQIVFSYLFLLFVAGLSEFQIPLNLPSQNEHAIQTGRNRSNRNEIDSKYKDYDVSTYAHMGAKISFTAFDDPSSNPSERPSSQPSNQPTVAPTKYPSAQPTSQPFSSPTTQPTLQPSVKPSIQPSNQPTSLPTYQPFAYPSGQPSSLPTSKPSQQPTLQPTGQPNASPTSCPTSQPSVEPTSEPTFQPSSNPTCFPTSQPSAFPSFQPQSCPTSVPSAQPSTEPSSQPSKRPSTYPSSQPSSVPSMSPSNQPSSLPSAQPSSVPSMEPSSQPTSNPTCFPTSQPSAFPSFQPQSCPTSVPSAQPSTEPSSQPSKRPSTYPSSQPSSVPSMSPSNQPSSLPSAQPSSVPSMEPSSQPTNKPTIQPTLQPTSLPSTQPTNSPTMEPSNQPSSLPTTQPTSQPSGEPSAQPIMHPTSKPSGQPTSQPSTPSSQPSSTPTIFPTFQPTSRPSLQPSVQPSTQPSLQPISFPTSSPSSIPTSAPSCGVGHEGTHGSCIPCEPGFYLSNREWEQCRKCEIDYIQPNSAQSECNRCDYPLATTKMGSTTCDAWGLMLNVPGLWFAYTLVLAYCLFQFSLLFFTHYKWQVGVFCLLSFGQVCNTLGDIFFFITQRMFVSIFALILGVVFLKIIFFLWVVRNKIEHPNVFAANHIQKLFTGDQVIFWLRFVNGSIVDVRNRAAPLHFFSNGEDAATADRLARYLLDYLIFVLLQLLMIFVFMLWMVSTSFLWFPVLCLGFCLMEMKVLCFWWLFRIWNFLWTFKIDPHFKDELLNEWDTTMHKHVSVLLWKYSIINDGLIQSFPMFALKLTHLLFFPTISLVQRILLIVSIALSGFFCIYSATVYFEMIQNRRNRQSTNLLHEQAHSIVEFVRGQSQSSTLTELHDRVDALRVRMQNIKCTTAEQQLFVAMQCHTQESVDIMLRLASLGMTSPDQLRHGSAASICEIISHVRHHPLPGDAPLGKDADGKEQDIHEPLRKTMRSIANCVSIQKSFFYRTMRFYKKRFAQAVNEVRRQYRVEKMTTVSQKLMWYSGVSVLVMFVKIFLLYVIFLLNRLIFSLSSIARHSRTLRYLFNNCCSCCCGELSAISVDFLTNPATQNFVPPQPSQNESVETETIGIEMTPSETQSDMPVQPGESNLSIQVIPDGTTI